MAKTVSVGELAHGGASRAIRTAQSEPVLVSKENRPAAAIMSAEKLAQVAEGVGGAPGAIYKQALALLAVDLYQGATPTLGQAAKLAALSLSDFIDRCGRLRVPVLWEPVEGIEADVEALTTALDENQTGDKAIA